MTARTIILLAATVALAAVSLSHVGDPADPSSPVPVDLIPPLVVTAPTTAPTVTPSSPVTVGASGEVTP